MKYVDEHRDPARLAAAVDALHRVTTRPWTIMEICGGQTHAIARWSLERRMPPGLTLVHGPGCPVCVTPVEIIEHARRLAIDAGVLLCTFGDMMRVPGTGGDLLAARAEGADVRVVVSPLDAVRLAAQHPARQVVFFGVGFETTAPTVAAAVEAAHRLRLPNFAVLAAHVRVPPAMAMILEAPDNAVQAFLAAGHVCTVEGTADYPAIARRFAVPVVVTGFEPLDLLEGLRRAVLQLEAGRAELEIQYDRAVRPEGNPLARAAVERVFEVVDRRWRGLGVVPQSGLRIREAFARHDAERRFGPAPAHHEAPGPCRAADVLRGRLHPVECPELGRGCTPERPLGAPMVSSEGACAAFYRYRRVQEAG
jgi:hydrogenase expression/formation protein HypD